MTVKITSVGFETLAQRLQILAEQRLGEAMLSAGEESSQLVLTTMQANTPVDTGNLRDSERIEKPTLTTWFIGPDLVKAHYAPFVEFGFHHYISGAFIQGRRYIQNTVLQTNPVVKEIFRQKIVEAIKIFS